MDIASVRRVVYIKSSVGEEFLLRNNMAFDVVRDWSEETGREDDRSEGGTTSGDGEVGSARAQKRGRARAGRSQSGAGNSFDSAMSIDEGADKNDNQPNAPRDHQEHLLHHPPMSLSSQNRVCSPARLSDIGRNCSGMISISPDIGQSGVSPTVKTVSGPPPGLPEPTYWERRETRRRLAMVGGLADCLSPGLGSRAFGGHFSSSHGKIADRGVPTMALLKQNQSFSYLLDMYGKYAETVLLLFAGYVW